MSTSVTVKGYSTSHSRKESGVYTLTVQKTGQVYVGSTTDIHRRMIQHSHGFRHGTHSNANLREAVSSGGDVILDFTPVDGSLEEIRSAEEDAIKHHLEAGNLLNVSLKPDCPMYGARHSDESKQKIAEANKGKVVSEETKIRRSQSMVGVKHTEMRRRNVSDAKTKYSIEVDGVVYKNAEEAAKALGLKSKGAVRNRCLSPNYPNYSRLDVS